MRIGESPAGTTRRRKMWEMAQAYGMDLDESCEIIVEQVAQGKFWVHTQPEMSMGAVESRIDFFRSQQAPVMSDEVRYLVEP